MTFFWRAIYKETLMKTWFCCIGSENWMTNIQMDINKKSFHVEIFSHSF